MPSPVMGPGTQQTLPECIFMTCGSRGNLLQGVGDTAGTVLPILWSVSSEATPGDAGTGNTCIMD